MSLFYSPPPPPSKCFNVIPLPLSAGPHWFPWICWTSWPARPPCECPPLPEPKETSGETEQTLKCDELFFKGRHPNDSFSRKTQMSSTSSPLKRLRRIGRGRHHYACLYVWQIFVLRSSVCLRCALLDHSSRLTASGQKKKKKPFDTFKILTLFWILVQHLNKKIFHFVIYFYVWCIF